jgi:hypothetical protein
VGARQPCYLGQPALDLGQWLCVPPFRVVCLCQAVHPPNRKTCATKGWEGEMLVNLSTTQENTQSRRTTHGALIGAQNLPLGKNDQCVLGNLG